MSQEQLGATLTSLGLQAVTTSLTPEQEERAQVAVDKGKNGLPVVWGNLRPQ